jgi:hypothetical protein
MGRVLFLQSGRLELLFRRSLRPVHERELLKVLGFRRGAAVAALVALNLASARASSDQAVPLHAFSKGERFVYSRVITFRGAGGIQRERSTITLDVSDVSGASAAVRQRISVNGAPEKTRDIVASTDGRWSYPDHNSVAQDFATWDANQFGKAPGDPRPGQTWELDVPQSAMFVAGHAMVKILSVHDTQVLIEANGDSGRRDDAILDRDTHKYVPVSVRGTWKVNVTYQNGIVQEFHRSDHAHYSVNRNAAQTDDDTDVSIHLVSHAG